MNFDGLAQDCSISSAIALEIPQSGAQPSIYSLSSRKKQNAIFTLSREGNNVAFLLHILRAQNKKPKYLPHYIIKDTKVLH